jgi:hypothetical protein
VTGANRHWLQHRTSAVEREKDLIILLAASSHPSAEEEAISSLKEKGLQTRF